jgi:hypothetical protein
MFLKYCPTSEIINIVLYFTIFTLAFLLILGVFSFVFNKSYIFVANVVLIISFVCFSFDQPFPMNLSYFFYINSTISTGIPLLGENTPRVYKNSLVAWLGKETFIFKNREFIYFLHDSDNITVRKVNN